MHESITQMRSKIGLGEQPHHTIRKWLVGVLVLLGLFYIVTLFLPKKSPLEYVTHTLDARPLTILVATTGNLEPIEQVDVGSEISGTIAKLYADFDDKVKAGALLAQIDTTKLEASIKSYEAALLQAKASMQEAKATLIESQKAYERALKLRKDTKGSLPSVKEMDATQATYERAKARKMSARAQIKQAEAALDMERYNLSKARIVSPIEGIVLERKVDAGQTVAAALQTPVLFTIAKSLKQMRLIVNIDEADVGLIRQGQKATFTVDTYKDELFKATITKVRLNATEENGVVTYEAELHVDNSDLRLRPGMTALTNIIVKEIPKGMIVPNSALRFKPSQAELLTKKEQQASHVWVLESDKPLYKAVTAGYSDGSYTSIKSDALQLGDEVIIKSRKAGH